MSIVTAFHRFLQTLAFAFCVTLALLSLGFLVFLFSVSGEQRLSTKVDGIVALSGDPERIRAAVDLLVKGYTDRLFISGLDNADEISRARDVHVHLFDCCVETDPVSRNTFEDAAVTKKWALRNHLQSLGVVTSNTHMPRALLELDRALPKVTKVPHSVVTGATNVSRWWHDPKALKSVLREYVKYLATGVAR